MYIWWEWRRNRLQATLFLCILWRKQGGIIMKTVGIDIGGTQTRVAIFEHTTCIAQTRFATNPNNPLEHMQTIVDTIQQLASNTYEAIGVACPGPLDIKQGIVLNPPNLPGWHQFPLVETLKHLSGKHVVMDNDANLAAFAEACIGAGATYDIVQYFTVSTGLGGGLVVNGSIFQGAHGFAQEIANCLVDETQYVKGATIQGSLERICSGTGIYELGLQAGLPIEDTADVFTLAAEGNEQAQAVIDYAACKLGNFCATVQGIIDPDIMVFGGSVARHNPGFVDKVAQQAKTKVYDNVAPFVRCEIAQCGDDAGIIGAALWAQNSAIK